jgi:hypothetical protein
MILYSFINEDFMRVLGFIIEDKAFRDFIGPDVHNSYIDLLKAFDKYCEKDNRKSEEYDWFFTSNMQIFEWQPHVVFDKIILIQRNKGDDGQEYTEIWPDDHLWNPTNSEGWKKEIRPAHNFRKLIIPFLNTFVYSKEELNKRNEDLAKSLSYSGITEYNGKVYKDGKETTWEKERGNE